MQGTGVGDEKIGNRRTALALAAIALAFFLAVVLRYWLAQ